MAGGHHVLLIGPPGSGKTMLAQHIPTIQPDLTLKEAAGDKGSKVHTAIAMILSGATIRIDEAVLNPSTEREEPLTLEEYQAILSFVAWHRTTQPILVAQDLVVWNEIAGYAGTIDAIFLINGELWVVDFKTSKFIWPSHRLQISAYKHATVTPLLEVDWEKAKLAILQLGYERNQLGYRLTEVMDCYPLFLATKQLWAEETKGHQPAQKDYPLSITLAPAASPVADAVPRDTRGENDEQNHRGRKEDRLRESGGGRGGGRVADRDHRGGPVRRAPGVPVKE